MKKFLFSLYVFALVFLPVSAFAGYTGYDYFRLDERAAPSTPASGKMFVYVNSSGQLVSLNDDGTSTILTSGSGDNTLDDSYDQGGAGAGATIDAADGPVIISNNDTDNANLLNLDFSPAASASGDALNITVGANSTGAAIDLSNSGTGYDIEGSGDTWYVTKAGAASFTSFYQAAIASAASGNVAVTIDASGNGTITIGSISTGALSFASAESTFTGNLTVGNAATDTLTVTAIVDSNVTLDDGVTNSPSLIFKDATDETATIAKVDASHLAITPGSATESLQILTGNLKVGAGSEGVTLNGEDAYISGTFEVDGASQLDGALTCNSTAALNGNITVTYAATELITVDAATTDSTTTGGVLDINFDSVTNGSEAVNIKSTFVAGGGGSEVVSAIVVDLDDDSDAAGTVVGLDINSSDATGSSSVVGIRLGNALEQGVNMTLAAAAQGIILDAATTDSTAVEGVIDVNYDTITTAAEAINVDLAVGDAAGAVTVTGILVDLDDDTATAAGTIRGFSATSSDLSGHANTTVTAFYTTGCEVALQADFGYIRIGTGSTPDVTPGDDDLFVEGTVEVDGASRFDGALTANAGIAGDGQSNVVGVTSLVEAYTGADNVIAIAESGTVFTNAGDADGSLHTLPEASTAIGCTFTFVVTAAQTMIVELDNADVFLHLTLDAGDQIQSATVGDSITVKALDATNWGVISVYPTAADWADGGA